jgi:hypothetical protein
MLSVEMLNVIMLTFIRLNVIQLIAFMLNIFMLITVMLNIIMLSVFTLNAIVLRGVMLSIVAPWIQPPLTIFDAVSATTKKLLQHRHLMRQSVNFSVRLMLPTGLEVVRVRVNAAVLEVAVLKLTRR